MQNVKKSIFQMNCCLLFLDNLIDFLLPICHLKIKASGEISTLFREMPEFPNSLRPVDSDKDQEKVNIENN